MGICCASENKTNGYSFLISEGTDQNQLRDERPSSDISDKYTKKVPLSVGEVDVKVISDSPPTITIKKSSKETVQTSENSKVHGDVSRISVNQTNGGLGLSAQTSELPPSNISTKSAANRRSFEFRRSFQPGSLPQ